VGGDPEVVVLVREPERALLVAEEARGRVHRLGADRIGRLALGEGAGVLEQRLQVAGLATLRLV
jgi:hypothetical protein